MDNPLAHPPAGSMVSPSHRVFRDVPALNDSTWFDERKRIIEKYKAGRVLDKEDEWIVDELASVGLMHTGISLTLMKRTAKSCSFGKRIFGVWL